MTATIALFGLLGAGFAAGILLMIAGLRPAADHSDRRRWWTRPGPGADRDPHAMRWLLAAAAVGVGVGVATGWIVGGLLAGLAVWGLPRVLGGDKEHARQVARIEAIAAWAEMLRDTLAAAAGLEQAILATAANVPDAIRDEIGDLAFRLDRGDRLAPSLRVTADRLADPTADLVVSALVLASEHRARNLADLLGELAAETREQAAMRLRVEAGRARTRTTVRLIVGTTLAFAAGLVVLNRGYLAPFDTAVGQLILAVIGGLFAASFLWLARIARIRRADRFLTNLAAITATSIEGDQVWREEVSP
jgi:tight adherence protein B